ncbi:uncharacterized protein LOC141876074 [Acropora palmata]|uniref:uncharacterized protein LOC141876074 n=1 Tax=Acropora palmata TaxID=6131 RepID=UPI003DA0B880
MTGVIAEVMYKHLEGILPEEQKGCRRRSRGTKDQLLIDKAILKDCKRRHTNLAMAWIDYRKAYDMVPHSWIGECLEMFGIAVNIDSLVQTVHRFSIDMEFGIRKCGVLVLKRGKIAKMERVLLPDGQVMKEIEDRGYRYLGILETDHLKEKEMKDLFSKEYKRRLKLVLKSKLSGKNKIMAAKTWAVAILRYSAGVVEWKTDELKVLDRKTRKMMTLYGALHPKSDVDRVYLARQKEGRGLISCEMCVKAEENNLPWMCNQKGEAINHILSECKMLAQKEYKRRHDNIARLVHWKLCCKYDMSRGEKWYEHQPEGVVENEKCKIL